MLNLDSCACALMNHTCSYSDDAQLMYLLRIVAADAALNAQHN
jgi:hypothetical protein